MQEIMDYIESFSKGGRRVSDLSRFTGLMERLGNPQDEMRFIHIAGTNGKGSTARFCGAALTAAGYKVGEFTSPFMVEYSDRIRVGGANIPAEKITEYGNIVRQAVGENRDYSQFEITNAIAFLHFKAEKCDVVVLETGLGGLLDATNIIKSPLISIITSISLDHLKILGATVEEIAAHKAGIIKAGCPALLSMDNLFTENSSVVTSLVRRTAKEKSAPLILPRAEDLGALSVSIFGNRFTYHGKEYATKMGGRHQVFNAISAIEAMNCLNGQGFSVSEEALAAGLLSAAVPARGEVVSKNPLILLDGAHNPDAAAVLAALVTAEIPTEKVVWAVGMLTEKEVSATVSVLARSFEGGKILCVDGFAAGAVPARTLAEEFAAVGVKAEGCCDFKEAVFAAEKLVEDDGVIVICGSLYLAAEVRKIIAI